MIIDGLKLSAVSQHIPTPCQPSELCCQCNCCSVCEEFLSSSSNVRMKIPLCKFIEQCKRRNGGTRSSCCLHQQRRAHSKEARHPSIPLAWEKSLLKTSTVPRTSLIDADYTQVPFILYIWGSFLHETDTLIPTSTQHYPSTTRDLSFRICRGIFLRIRRLGVPKKSFLSSARLLQ